MAGRRVDAITFDFWNTLVQAELADANERRISAWQGFLAEVGAERESVEVQAAQDAGWRWFDTHWLAGTPPTTRDVVAHTVEVLLGTPHDPLADRITEWMLEGPPAELAPAAPGIGEALEGLKAAGLRIGIICDVGLTPGVALRRVLADHGLLPYFDHWSFSDEVGVFKPSPVIFTHAADGLGMDDPDRTAHIGDLRRTDVAGARAAGWLALRYRGLHDDPGSEEHGTLTVEGHHVLDEHTALPDLLG